VSSVAIGEDHALALAEDGLVYAWGENTERALLGNPHVERELLPKPVEALRGIRVGSIAAADNHSYALADSGVVWAWGLDEPHAPLGHGEQSHCPLLKLMESLRGTRVDAVATGGIHTLALADDGSVYAWGGLEAAVSGALGLGLSVQDARKPVPTPRRIPGLRVAYGLWRVGRTCRVCVCVCCGVAVLVLAVGAERPKRRCLPLGHWDDGQSDGQPLCALRFCCSLQPLAADG
jgi:hypothetical protein